MLFCIHSHLHKGLLLVLVFPEFSLNSFSYSGILLLQNTVINSRNKAFFHIFLNNWAICIHSFLGQLLLFILSGLWFPLILRILNTKKTPKTVKASDVFLVIIILFFYNLCLNHAISDYLWNKKLTTENFSVQKSKPFIG